MAALSDASHQERDVSALPTPISVQLIEHQEREALSGPNHRAVDRAREQVLEHHVVREQDVRRVVPDLVALLLGLLARVPAERHRRLALGVAELQELRQLVLLASWPARSSGRRRSP